MPILNTPHHRYGSDSHAPVPHIASSRTPSFDPRDRRDLCVMRKRIQSALANVNVITHVSADLSVTLSALGITAEPAAQRIHSILLNLAMSSDGLLRTEDDIRFELHLEFPNFKSDLAAGLSGRAKLVTQQLLPYIKPGKRIADLGCGDGQVTQLVNDIYNPSYIVGYDVVNYRAKDVTVPTWLFDGRFVPLGADETHSFDYVLLTNVLHHAEHNDWLIAEAHRLLKPGGRALVHETIPIPAFETDPVEIERLFMLDYIYNRIFHSADIPVPGAYETMARWVERFKFGGRFERTDIVDLEIDQPLIRDHHVLYEFVARPLFRRSS